jgi:hypothetical protein
MPEEKRGWPDWVKGIALYALRPDGTLGMIMTDEAGNLRVVFFPHAITHQKGGSDELNVQGLSGVLANLQYAKLSYVGTRATFPTGLEAGALAYATDEKVLYRWDGSSWVKLTAGTFISLMDTPASYAGKAGWYPRVKATEDGLEFVQFATPGPHATNHRKDGVDPLPTAAPGTLTEGATPSEGTSAVFARADHVHGTPSQWTPKAHASTHRKDGSDPLPTAAPAAITEGASASEGTSAVFARADHIHASPTEWTPKVHGNTKHSPEFLARDGSNTMAGNLVGSSSAPFYWLKRFVVKPSILGGETVFVPYLENDIGFLTARGGSVTCNPAPTVSPSRMFDCTPNYTYWSNPTGSIVVEITFPTSYEGQIIVYLLMEGWAYARDILAEYYDPTTSEWKMIASVQNLATPEIAWFKEVYPGQASKLRLTFSNFTSSSYFAITEIGVIARLGELFKSVLLSRDGGKMFGDIDMNSYNINNPNLVDGVDVSAHASRHRKDGADPLPTGAPAAITEGASASEGSSAVFARADHRHATPTEWTPKVHGNDKHSPNNFAAIVFRVPSGADFNVTAPTSWTTLDLSGIVGARRALVCITVYNGGSLDNNYCFRDPTYNRPDSTLYADTNPGITKCRVAALKSESILIWTNSSGRVQWWAQNAYTTLLYVEWFIYAP